MKKVLQKYWAWAFVVIPLLLQAIFFYVPMFQGAFYSFTNWTGLTYNYKFVGLNNFKLLFMDPKFMNAIGFTAIITIAMVVGEIAVGIFIARVLNLLPCVVLLPSCFVWFDSGFDLQTSLQLRSTSDWECPSYRVSSNQSFRD